ncbi:Ubiquitin carboxyl-terminal hydrolase-like domain [Lasallia pustulata]|uniref:Ubiquitin carboxyl-terminal hydrolase-like domain n=1 Tax=Lasallia pustulata TaxID=136370 RepID=A0A1W5D5V5_9LECA|nr:Ubiquitin carboxyl-terminal hydrolase-like domain [Lasallia pustulata]
MALSKREQQQAALKEYKAQREQKAGEKEKVERKKKIEVHRDVDNMPPPVAGMKRKCGGEEETLSGKRQKTETCQGVLQPKPLLRKAGGSSFFNHLHKKGDKPIPSQAMVRTVDPVRSRAASSLKTNTKASLGESMLGSQANPTSKTPAPGPAKGVQTAKKRKAEEAEQQAHKKRKTTGARFGARETAKVDKVPDRGTDPKTSESKAIGPELPSTSARVASTIAGPKNGPVTDQKPGNFTKTSKSKATGPELSGTSITPTKDQATDPPAGKTSASKAAGPELPGTPTEDQAIVSPTGKPSTSKAAGPELPGAIDGDVADTGKGKASGPEPSGTSKKRTATEAGLQEKPEVKKPRRAPVGLLNHKRACFINAATQCLRGTAPIEEYCRRQANGVLHSVTNCGVNEEDLRSMVGNTRAVSGKKDKVRKAFQASAKDISLSAYFGDLCRRMSTATEPCISPFLFQQAFGTRFNNVGGQPMNGETSEDSSEFLTNLLGELKQEELMSRKTESEEPTVVERVFGVTIANKVACDACGHRRYLGTENRLYLQARIPSQKIPLTLEECFSSFSDRNRPPVFKCGNCGEADSTEKSDVIMETHNYLILQIDRVGPSGKNTTEIRIPQGTIDLSAWATASASEDPKFEVYGIVQHHGTSHTDGHYTAVAKVEGEWWLLDDHSATHVDDTDIERALPGCLIFLRKVSA